MSNGLKPICSAGLNILQVPVFPILASGLRLTMWAIMNQEEHALTLFAPDCGSWGLPARSTSGRSFINPQGYEAYGFVHRANVMVSRNLVHQ